jgi:hypothetical protein
MEASEQALTALAELFDKHLKTPDARKAFFSGQTKAPEGLPQPVADHLADLSYEELRLLARTYDAMQQGGLTHDVRGIKVSFL